MSQGSRWSRRLGLILCLGITIIAGNSEFSVEAQSPPALTFQKDVLPILQKNCQSCHRPGQIAPMSLLTYENARPWARAIKAKVVSREMPPWFADPQYNQWANNRRLSDRDMDILVRWVDGGALPGDAKDAPPPVLWPADGWEIQPDMILNTGLEVLVPATGIMDLISVTIPSGFTKDTWVSSMEIRPSEIAVTHHICLQIHPHQEGTKYRVLKSLEKPRDGNGAEIPPPSGGTTPQNIGTPSDCYLPGHQSADYRPFNAARLIPAGADITFSLHYTPSGKETIDRPQIGFTLAKEPPQRQYVMLNLGGNRDRNVFAIPPRDPDWQPPRTVVMVTEDVELVSAIPHMHMRGKEMTTRLQYPDGRSEVFLHVPNYDYNWQINYQAAKPTRLPKGTKIIVDAHYNNSASNRKNPNPNQTVYYGDQLWEEMMGHFTGFLVDAKVDYRTLIKKVDLASNVDSQ